jgi:hypothetical protein
MNENRTESTNATLFRQSRLYAALDKASKEQLIKIIAAHPAQARADYFKDLVRDRSKEGANDAIVAEYVTFAIAAILDAHDTGDGDMNSQGYEKAVAYCLGLMKEEENKQNRLKTWKTALGLLLHCWSESNDEEFSKSILTEIVALIWWTDDHRKIVVEGLRREPGASLERITRHWLMLDDQTNANQAQLNHGHANEVMKSLQHKAISAAGPQTIRRIMQLTPPCESMPEACFQNVLEEARRGQELGEAVRKIGKAVREAADKTGYTRMFGRSFDFTVAVEFEYGQPRIKMSFWARDGLYLPHSDDIMKVAKAARLAANACGVASLIIWERRDGCQWLLEQDGQLWQRA